MYILAYIHTIVALPRGSLCPSAKAASAETVALVPYVFSILSQFDGIHDTLLTVDDEENNGPVQYARECH